ncbi:LysR family transcriptional regulator [Phreatobacter sp. AB_2022a]|uniref:LysR family transcriptional regulator n=1 Tax=Phreatobacter sp. AB_2022a TaxID=3003134 RepID=UPI0022876775|nr:LysR family transcriptional regulator [Phreatobacter sp. AB_2022a]MCZ0735767.1 LysR family transcriptional regulator [Phreatobacter sp. AB_2022a]
MSGLSLDQLRRFADVVELGSFSAAAERAGISQPAVSLAVRQLEKRLGSRLVERVGRRVRPTAAGSELMAHAARIDDVVAAMLDGMARHASGTVGRVRLGTGATACIYLLPPILRALRQRLPSIEITVSTGNTADVVKAVEDNLLDIGLVTLPVSGRMLETLPVCEDEFVAIQASDGPPLPATVTAEALSRLPLLLYEPGANTRRLADEWFARSGIRLQPVMSLGSVEAIKQLVAAGLGAAILPRLSVPDDAADGLVVRSLTPRLSRRLVLVLRRDKPLGRALKAMIEALTGAGDGPQGAAQPALG